MNKFKKFMRDAVSLVWFLMIGFWIAYKTADTIQGKENIGGDLLYICGLAVATAVLWLGSTYFIVWLTDGTWEYEEGEGKQQEPGNPDSCPKVND